MLRASESTCIQCYEAAVRATILGARELTLVQASIVDSLRCEVPDLPAWTGLGSGLCAFE